MTRILTLGAMLLVLALIGCEKAEEQQPAPATEETTTEQAADTTQTAGEEMKETAEDVAEKTADMAGQAKEAAGEAAEDTKKMAAAAADKTGEMMDQAKEATTAAADKAVETAKEMASPDTLVLEASFGNVTFPHAMHAEAYDCATCHGEGTPGLFGLDKETAHPLCQGCHKEQGAGPTGCTGCHKK